jgi:hypothetical protein
MKHRKQSKCAYEHARTAVVALVAGEKAATTTTKTRKPNEFSTALSEKKLAKLRPV